MPNAAPRPCTWPGCPALVHGASRCPTHRRKVEQQRGSAHSRGYTSAWTKARDAWLRLHPLCACPECDEGRKRYTAATVVDHKIAHKGDKRLFWDSSNWQSMAKPCHDRKTVIEDGGFGH